MRLRCPRVVSGDPTWRYGGMEVGRMLCRVAMKALGVAAAARVAFVPFLVLAPVGNAYPCATQMASQQSRACINGPAPAALPRQTQAPPPPTEVPVQTPKINPK